MREGKKRKYKDVEFVFSSSSFIPLPFCLIFFYFFIFYIWGDGRHQVLSTVTRLSNARKMQAARVSVDTEDRRPPPGLGSSLAIDTGFCRASPSCASPEIAMKTWVSIDTRDRRPSPGSLSNLDLHMLVCIHSKNTYESNLKMKQKQYLHHRVASRKR